MSPADAAPVFTAMLHAIDARDWKAVRDSFDVEIDIDYSALFGEPAKRVKADAHVAGWEVFAGAFDATQHLTGPFVVQETTDGVRADTHIRAYHRIDGARGGDLWVVVGHYEVRLRRVGTAWKIAGITLRVFYQEGNREIPEIARGRAAAAGKVGRAER
jgi:hypothetical protein